MELEHGHPNLKRPVPRSQVRRELANLYRQAGLEGPLDLEWTEALGRTHDRNWRRYAQVRPLARPAHFELAPQTVYLPPKNRRALLAHEVGHVLDPHGTEDEADEAARRALGIRISYDRRWPGKGLQFTRDNPRRKGYLLDELLEAGGQSSPIDALLRNAQRVIADEPMRWYFEESEKEYWNEKDEFRNVAPVHEVLWIEHRAPRFVRSEEYGIVPWPEGNWQRAGTLMVTVPREHYPHPQVAQEFPGARWITRATVFTAGDRYGAPGAKWTYIYGVGPDGSMTLGTTSGFMTHSEGQFDTLLVGQPTEARQEVANFYKAPWRVAMLALYFMHAKGTELRPVRVSPKVAAARRKKGRPTGEGYKVLDVGLGARKTLAEAKAEGGGAQSAMRKHLRRGGFATYVEERPHVSGFVGDMWRSPSVVGRGKEELQKDYRVRRPDKRKKKRKRKRKRNPSSHEQVREHYRRWTATQDPEDYRLWQAARVRIGLAADPVSWPRCRAVQEARPSHRRKRLRVVEAEAVIETWLRERGWRVDPRARIHGMVWISPDLHRRVTFKRTHVVFERGGRGHWSKDYDIHELYVPLGTIDFAERLLRNTKAKLEDPYARNPEEKFLPARLQTPGLPPRRHSFELMASGQAPLIFLPAGHSPTSLALATDRLGSMLARPAQDGGLADPDAWENLLAAVGGDAKVYAVDRNGERWEVLRVNWDPGGYTGEINVRHQGRHSRGGRTHWLDLEQFYGQMLPVVVYKGRRR
jgi:hypothetical protein